MNIESLKLYIIFYICISRAWGRHSNLRGLAPKGELANADAFGGERVSGQEQDSIAHEKLIVMALSEHGKRATGHSGCSLVKYSYYVVK